MRYVKKKSMTYQLSSTKHSNKDNFYE